MANEREGLIQITQDLIRIDTCQPKGNEKKLVRYIIKLFEPFLDKIDIHSFEHGSNRSSLLIKINGENDIGGIAFSGHLDTVSVGRMNEWRYDPFSGHIENGFIHGRGSVDMKAGVAAIIMVGLHILESKKELKEPIFLCFSADEEQDGLGIESIAKTGLLNNIRGVVIAEPTDKKIAIAEKGALWISVEVQGKLAHGSKPEKGINSIEYGILFAERLEKYFLKEFNIDPLLGRASVALTKFNGGIMTNIIPAEAILEFDIRTLPHMDHKVLLTKFKEIIENIKNEKPGIEMSIKVLNNRPSVAVSDNDDFVKLVQKVAREHTLDDSLYGMTYYTDAAQLIPIINKPFVIMGPGNEAHAHQLDEAVRIDDINMMYDVYSSLVNKI